MYAATTGFIQALRWGSVLMAAQLTLSYKRQLTSIVLPVSAGAFTIDRNSSQRRTGELTLEILPTIPPQTVQLLGAAQPILPIKPSSPLAPFGNEVSVSLALLAPGFPGQPPVVRRADGTADPTTFTNPSYTNGWVPMGTYAIATSTIDDTGNDLTLTLDLYDRSWIFSRWSLLKNYSVPASDGTLQGEVVALLTYIWNNNGPGRTGVAVPSWITSPNITPSPWACSAGVYQQGQDPWQACLDLAASAGYELFFDVNGVLTGKPNPGSTAGGLLSSLPVVWGFNPGEITAQGTYKHALGGTPYTTPVGNALSMTRDKIYNDWFVSAIAVDGTPPVQSEAKDTNPNSATNINSEIGLIPNFVFDANITTATQAAAEAQYDLAVSLSSAWTIAVTTALNPLFDVDDVCTLTNPRLGLTDQKFIVDTITTGIRYDAQSVLTGRVIVAGS